MASIRVPGRPPGMLVQDTGASLPCTHGNPPPSEMSLPGCAGMAATNVLVDLVAQWSSS